MMRRLLLIGLPGLLIFSCKQNSVSPERQLTVDEFIHVMDSLPDEQLIDVRTPEECAKGIISGATNIDIQAAGFEDHLKKLDKEKPVMVYCRSGKRSANAVSIMHKLGFKKVYDLQGGTLAWYSAGQPLISTEKVKDQYTVAYFDSLIKVTRPVLVDFYAPWCAPCKKIEKSLRELKEIYGDKFDVVRINVDDNPEFSKTMGIDNLPILQLYKNGNKVWEKKSEASKEEMEALLKSSF